MTTFDEATAVTRIGPGRYTAHPDQRFALVAPGGTTPPAINGGVMLATVLRAVLDCSPLPHPVATSAHYLRVARLAPAQIEVTWLKTGRTAATARATLTQDDEPILETTVTTGTVPVSRPDSALVIDGAERRAGGAQGQLSAGGAQGQLSAGGAQVELSAGGAQVELSAGGAQGQLTWTGVAPAIPPVGECVNLGEWTGTHDADGVAGYAGQVSMLLDPAVTGWRFGQPSGMPEMRGYFSLREEREPDALMLALAVDGLPPVVFGLGATGWAPTVELTMHMRLVPASGPLAVQARCRHVSGGWFDEEAEVWDSAGNLVAQSRQIARVGRGPVRSHDPA